MKRPLTRLTRQDNIAVVVGKEIRQQRLDPVNIPMAPIAREFDAAIAGILRMQRFNDRPGAVAGTVVDESDAAFVTHFAGVGQSLHRAREAAYPSQDGLLRCGTVRPDSTSSSANPHF
ncbi:hypothetical protein [Paraburkholderia fynbosensis]|uniref:hypothetical protein n=1 Tax=Paraburkholderia fynbosensis TaxID=1200993 RepID=UPI0015841165|nr:hypothetical protein [Paraburkholderia fynbosensis]